VRQRWYWKSENGQITDLTSATSTDKYMFLSRFRRVLTIKKLTVGDAGVYGCEATYRVSSRPAVTLRAEARLTVHGLYLSMASALHHSLTLLVLCCTADSLHNC